MSMNRLTSDRVLRRLLKSGCDSLENDEGPSLGAVPLSNNMGQSNCI